MPSLLDVAAAHNTVSAWKKRQRPLSVDSLMASAQLGVLEWFMGGCMGIPDEGRFKETLERMKRDLALPAPDRSPVHQDEDDADADEANY